MSRASRLYCITLSRNDGRTKNSTTFALHAHWNPRSCNHTRSRSVPRRSKAHVPSSLSKHRDVAHHPIGSNRATAHKCTLGAQGHEGGGHTGEVGSIVLWPEVIEAVAPIPVLAAGGIGTGPQVAAAMALGAAGV